MLQETVNPDTIIGCYHCGEQCDSDHPIEDDLDFCCQGCRMVYMMLSSNGLSAFYDIEANAGPTILDIADDLSYLDDSHLIDLLSVFRQDGVCKVIFSLPQIHCSACIWLLEHLGHLGPGIRSARVNFLKKEVSILFEERETSLKEIVRLLNKIGYPPRLNLNDLNPSNEATKQDKGLLYKIGVAAFCFGNIMLLSFPEYLGVYQESWLVSLGYLNIVLSLPILMYSGSDYLLAAFRCLRMKRLGIDIPIAIGMMVLFLRSVYEIISFEGSGYLDSLSGFIFFLLIGRWFQQYTFQHISFKNDYRSFLPISVLKSVNSSWKSVSLDQIELGDIIKILPGTIIPCDGYIIKGRGYIDYSFVTGESKPIRSKKDEEIFAGGKQCRESIELRVSKKAKDGYLTQLWKEDVFNDDHPSETSLIIDEIGRYFTIVILVISLLTFLYWVQYDIDKAFQSFTAVLIIACPCVLALSIPFIYGNVIRVLSKSGMYCKNTSVIEKLTELSKIVFDKTGTITDISGAQTEYVGSELNSEEYAAIAAITSLSVHPLSQTIARKVRVPSSSEISNYQEHLGLGVEGVVGDVEVRLGSSLFILESSETTQTPCVFVEINGEVKGYFEFENPMRENIGVILNTLSEEGYEIHLLSGDNNGEVVRMKELFPLNSELLFNQSPKDKLEFIKELQHDNQGVMMIGDGLNDSGALKQSDVGLVVSQNDHFFAPSCDAIISTSALSHLDAIMKYINQAKYILYGAFVFAAIYNIIGLWFAMRGELSPVIAAVLMPTSSISMIIYGLCFTSLLSNKLKP